jgi:drug/metabolite transporter superfamily protein YnfA
MKIGNPQRPRSGAGNLVAAIAGFFLAGIIVWPVVLYTTRHEDQRAKYDNAARIVSMVGIGVFALAFVTTLLI